MAAQSQFLSSEKANEIFRHLVDEKGLSADALEEEVIHDVRFPTCAIFVIAWTHSSASCLLRWKHFRSEIARGTQC